VSVVVVTMAFVIGRESAPSDAAPAPVVVRVAPAPPDPCRVGQPC
jgi:hypothetical protein